MQSPPRGSEPQIFSIWHHVQHQSLGWATRSLVSRAVEAAGECISEGQRALWLDQQTLKHLQMHLYLPSPVSSSALKTGLQCKTLNPVWSLNVNLKNYFLTLFLKKGHVGILKPEDDLQGYFGESLSEVIWSIWHSPNLRMSQGIVSPLRSEEASPWGISEI